DASRAALTGGHLCRAARLPSRAYRGAGIRATEASHRFAAEPPKREVGEQRPASEGRQPEDSIGQQESHQAREDGEEVGPATAPPLLIDSGQRQQVEDPQSVLTSRKQEEQQDKEAA